MRKFFLSLLFALPLWAVAADDAVPNGFHQWNATAFAELRQSLAAKSAADAQHLASQKIADYPNDAIYEIHRAGDGAPELHETEADIFFVQSGSAVLVVGGILVGAETTAPHELRNGTIQGGVRKKISAGDVLRIPAKTPHQVVLDGAKEITYIVVKARGY
jgi:mannose-6-phosphate isomerase-like protein (cupin superfamily)